MNTAKHIMSNKTAMADASGDAPQSLRLGQSGCWSVGCLDAPLHPLGNDVSLLHAHASATDLVEECTICARLAGMSHVFNIKPHRYSVAGAVVSKLVSGSGAVHAPVLGKAWWNSLVLPVVPELGRVLALAVTINADLSWAAEDALHGHRVDTGTRRAETLILVGVICPSVKAVHAHFVMLVPDQTRHAVFVIAVVHRFTWIADCHVICTCASQCH